MFQYHPAIGYTFIPGIKARVQHEAGGYLVRINQTGFRSEHEFEKKKSPEKFRILIFGDSFTAADGVSNKFRYTDVLESLLPGTEVYNFAIPGTGTDQQYLTFCEYASLLEYDLLIIAVFVENVRRIASRYRIYYSSSGKEGVMTKPYYSLDNGGNLVLHNSPVPQELLSFDNLPGDQLKYLDRGGNFPLIRKVVSKFGSSAKNLVQKVSQYQPLPMYDDSNNPDWLLMKKILEKWVSESKTNTILFTIPLYQYIEETSSPKGYQARFDELDYSKRVIFHDPLPDLLEYTMEDRKKFRFKKDIHPTREFHKALANSLLPVVKSQIV